MASGYSFIDDPQMSVREKIDKYFQKKNSASLVPLDESTSDESIVNSFCGLDESFAEVLNNNPHVTLIRNLKKGNATQTESQTTSQIEHPENHEEQREQKLQQENQTKPPESPYLPTPTRRGQVRRPIQSDDSIEINPFDLWFVSDESFLEMEKSCESPREDANSIGVNDTTLLYDVQAPSFLIHDSDSDDLLDDSVFEHRPNISNISMLSPIKLVAMRRPSTILEESTIQSINSIEERSGSSLSLKQSLYVADDSNKSTKTRSYRPSLVNVFPTRSRIGFYDNMESLSSTSAEPSAKQSGDKENSINLMRFESLDLESPPSKTATPGARNTSISFINFDSSIDEANSSVDQTQHDASMSDSEPPDQFNDTLEAVDYYMKQGKKLMDKTGASTTFHQQPCQVPSPKNHRNNSLLKQTLARRHLMRMGDNNLTKKTLF